MLRRTVATCLAFAVISLAHAGPRILSYQGSLLDSSGEAVPDGVYDMRFRIFRDETGTVPAWQELETAVSVNGGLFSTLLGDQTNFTTQFSNDFTLWLEIAVDLNGNGSFESEEIYAPRQRLAGAAWAMETERLQGRAAADFAPTGHPHGWSELSGIPSGFADDVDNDSLADLSPSPGQTIRWNGSSWETVQSGRSPVAILQADPAVLLPNETTTTLRLDLSYDPQGGPLTYAFDPLGHTVGEPASFGAAPTFIAAYPSAGDYLATGWVKDSAGQLSRAQTLVSVFFFNTVVAASGGDEGRFPSLAEVAGRPAVAYRDQLNDNLKYVRAGDGAGASWPEPLTVDSAGNTGRDPSLAIVGGRPAIAYYDLTDDELQYVRANDAVGESWAGPVIIDSDGNVGRNASLVIVDGRPAVAYYDIGNTNLKYARASDAAGGFWGTPDTIDNDGQVGFSASMAIVDGRPAIAYYDDTNDDVKYVRASDAIGSSWGTPVRPAEDNVVGLFTSLAVVDGRPAIAFYDATIDGLKYVRANDATGSVWGEPVTLDSEGNPGFYASLAVVDGRPAVAYQERVARDLRYVHALDAAGNSWGSPLTVDSVDWVAETVSLAVVAGRPAIAHYDLTNDSLRYTFADR